jgi:acetyl-CoA carboxylase biotin carboxyl carrier protein
LDLNEIKDLIDLMRENELTEFKMEREGFSLTLKRGGEAPTMIASHMMAAPTGGYAMQPAAGAPASGGGGAPTASEPLREIPSPMVGTFYSAASPEARSYVTVGQEVTPDTVVCIVEAMKVMNEIKAETSGTVVEICAENGKPVQYGQPLFRLK